MLIYAIALLKYYHIHVLPSTYYNQHSYISQYVSTPKILLEYHYMLYYICLYIVQVLVCTCNFSM